MFSIQQQLYDSNDNNDVEEKKQQQNILKNGNKDGKKVVQ